MWNPAEYLVYADHRGRPYGDLIARVACHAPRRVVDLGCGPGNLTAGLRERWPGTQIEALDASPEMVAAARARGLQARVTDVRDWTPARDTDVVISNATLQWVPEHRELIRRWAAQLTPGAWLAFQVPGNFDAPSHRAIRSLAGGPWRAALAGLELRGPDAVDDAAGYARTLLAAGCRVDAWETTYLHELTGPDPVLEWVTGTALTPIRDVLDDAEWSRFRAELAPLLRAAYPEHAPGRVYLPFRRVFVVAQVD